MVDKMMYEGLFNRDSFPITDIETPGESVEDSLLRTLSKLHYAVYSGKRHWIITYSGGKDSTLLTVIACEIIRRSLNWKPDSIDVVYCDTLEEIPPMHQAALEFLNYIHATADEEALPIHTHIAQPAPKETYWYLMLGKGYPAPHRRFWWCTERLKINPVKRKLAELNHHQDGTAVLTGVRFGESDRRDGKMRKASQCMGEGECGQVLKYQGALAPIVHWKTCQVWDFLALMASSWGWPTHMVAELYGDAPIRFGCWVCTLIDRDQALDAVTEKSEWEYLSALASFKQKTLDATADPEARVTRPNGVPGKFKIATKKKLLRELEELQERIGLELISPDEERRIRHYWETDDKGDSY
jgi:DNA sulfur modification protein DndC